MFKVYNFLLVFLLSAMALSGWSQTTTISTVPTFANNNGSGTVAFNFRNNNPYPIAITDISGVTGTTGSCNAQFYYNTAIVNGIPSAIVATATGWSLAGSGTFTGVGNTTTTTLQPFLSGMSLIMPPNTTYGFAIFATGQRYATITGTPTISAGGCDMIFGGTNSYAGGTPPTSPTTPSRGWVGSITFHAVPQGTNNTGISALTQPGLYCAGNQTIKALIQNTGTNIVNNVTVGWSLNGVLQTPVNFTTPINTYSSGSSSAEVTLGTNVLLNAAPQHIIAWTSMPNGVADTITNNDTLDVTIQASLSGTYTVNPALPASVTNYQSIIAFADALNNYGVCGPVVANVAAGSGPYTGTLNLNNISGASATNTIKINGNGATIQYANTPSSLQLLILNGAHYVTIDSLTFKALDPNYGWAALITNGASYDSISRCTFDLSAVTSTSSAYNNGIAFSSSYTTPTTSGVNGTHCYIGNNRILGATGTGGMYYTLAISSGGNDSNVVVNNEFANYYYYGTYLSTATGNILKGNNYHKTTKTGSLTTFYGIYLTGTTPGTQIIGNRMHNPMATAGTAGFYGVYNLGAGSLAQPMLIANNAVYNINASGTLYGYYNSGSPYTSVYHNTITIDQALSGSTGVNYGFYFTGTNTNTTFKNNIVNITGGTTGIKYGFYITTAASIADAQKNNIYVNSTQSGAQYYGFLASAYATQAAFQAANPTLEIGSPSVAPTFSNVAAGDLTPGNVSLFGVGENLSAIVPKDILNITRSLTPTPGAFELTSTATNEAGMVSLISPTGAFCAGTQPVTVKVSNGGINTINSLQIQWTLNGVAQPTVTYTTPIYTITNPAGNTADILLANVPFSASPTVIKAWTYLPNGAADPNNTNDTLTVSVAASLSGTVTVNSALPTGGTNYQSFTDLTNTLNTYGVCGPVVVNVVPGSGPYNENIKLNNIAGTSAINTIRINGNGSQVQYTNTANDRQLLTLNGAKYVTVDSINFKSLAADYGWGAILMNGCRYDSITRCTFDLSATTSISSAQNSGISFSSSTTSPTTAGDNGSYCYIANNHIKGAVGTGGMYYTITVVSGGNTFNIIRDNEIENFYYYGIYINGAENTQIINNNIHKSTKTGSLATFYGIYATGTTPGLQIIGNRIHNPCIPTTTSSLTFYGMALYADGTAAVPVLIANNVVYNITNATTIYGLYISTALENRIFHNTINIDQALTGTSTNYGVYATGVNTNTSLKNNIINITGGSGGIKYGFYTSATTGIADLQRNNFYVNSTQAGAQYYGYYGMVYNTLTAFQNANPTMETGSVSIAPMFTNPATGNLKPLNFSLFGTGTNLGGAVPTDIINVSRSAVPTPGAYELPPTGLNNAASVTLLSPKGSFCAGAQPVKLAILNAGTNDINSLQIHWEVNGVSQPTYNYSNTLSSALNSGQYMDTVQLGIYNFNVGTPDTITAWTFLPNNTNDSYVANDTAQSIVEPSDFTVNAVHDTLCPNSATTIALTPSTGYYSGQLNWQRSANGINWSDIPNSDVVTYSTGTLPADQYFRVKISGGVNACYSYSAKILVVNPQITSADNISHCGDGVVTLSAQASTNSIIKWYDSPTATVPIGSGANYQTPLLTDTVTYYVNADIGSSGSTCATTKVPVTVYIIPKPDVDLGPNISQCVDSGTNITLDAGALPFNVTYLWDDGSTSQQRNVNTSGTYSVMATNQYQCSGGDTITVHILSNPLTNLGPDTSVCNGVALQLSSGVTGASSYYWNTGQTAPTITVTHAGTYSVVVTNDLGCTKSDTINVMMQGSLPSVSGITVTNNAAFNFHFEALNPQNVIAYEWNFGDGSALSNDVAPNHTYANAGVYLVVLKTNSSCGYTYDTLSANIVGIHDMVIDNSELLVFPNPSKGIANIRNTGAFNMKEITIYNMMGQLIYRKESDDKKQHQLDLSALASGVYTIQINTDKGSVTRKLEVIK